MTVHRPIMSHPSRAEASIGTRAPVAPLAPSVTADHAILGRARARHADRLDGLLDRSVRARGGALLQRALYIRGVAQVEPNLDRDIEALRGASKVDEGTLDNDVSRWLDGMGAMSTTRYNEGQMQYYAAVGFIVELDNPERILGNFAGDGNTTTMSPSDEGYLSLIESIRAGFVAEDRLHESWLRHAGEPGASVTTNAEAMKTLIEGFIRKLDGSTRAVAAGIVKSKAVVAQLTYYARAPGKGPIPMPENKVQKLALGGGLDPRGLTDTEKFINAQEGQVYKYGSSSELRYTESKVSAKLEDVKAVYYTADKGSFEHIKWASGEDWLEARRVAAERVYNKLRTAGARRDLGFMKLEAGTLHSVPPPDFKEVALVSDLEAKILNILDVVEAMGISRDQVVTALEQNDNDVQRATNALFA